MSETKTSIRFFDTTPVRSVWDEETSKWWLCVTDVVAAIVDTTNPRVYWATVKRRNSELFANCKQLKLKASDGKRIDLILKKRLKKCVDWSKIDKKEYLKAMEKLGNNNLARKIYLEIFKWEMIKKL